MHSKICQDCVQRCTAHKQQTTEATSTFAMTEAQLKTCRCDECTMKRELRLTKLETKPKTYIVGKGCSELAFAAAASKQVTTIESASSRCHCVIDS